MNKRISATRPNILFIMSDDHATNSIGCYGSIINQTPNIDRIAREGMRFDSCFCTNSICSPSRAVIMTSKYSHLNGVRALGEKLDCSRHVLFPKLMQKAGYQTSIVGKWHLGHGGKSDPDGFDFWSVLKGQGSYFDPEMIDMEGARTYNGYTTDVITDICLDWLRNRDKNKPFLLFCHHKAPHRPWHFAPRHEGLYKDNTIPEPETIMDNYEGRVAASRATFRIEQDIKPIDIRVEEPLGFKAEELKRWKYQESIKNYLRCVACVDESVGKLLNYLDEEGLTENTIVVYTSDQGFFLGDHGWFGKRFMYEESLQMPLLVRYPPEIPAGSVCGSIALNLDFAPTFLEYAGVATLSEMQGCSLVPLFRGQTPENWRKSMYYRYWMHMAYGVYSHYGVRTKRYKLIYYYADALGVTKWERCKPEWELYDLETDRIEMKNVYNDPEYADVVKELNEELDRLQKKYLDEPYYMAANQR